MDYAGFCSILCSCSPSAKAFALSTAFSFVSRVDENEATFVSTISREDPYSADFFFLYHVLRYLTLSIAMTTCAVARKYGSSRLTFVVLLYNPRGLGIVCCHRILSCVKVEQKGFR